MFKQSSIKKDYFQILIKACFHLLIFLTPFIFTTINDELFEFSKMHFVYLMTVVITASWLMRMVSQKKIIFTPSKLDIPVLLFLLSQILSTIFSIHTQTSLNGYYSRLHGGLFSTISYTLLFFAFTASHKKSDLIAYAKTLIISVLLINLYAIPERFGHSMSCVLIDYSLYGYSTDCWIQNVQERIFASLGQPNWLAALLVLIIPLLFSFFILNNFTKKPLIRNKILNFLIVISIPLSIFSLIFTKSRSGIYSLLISSVIYLVILTLIIKRKKIVMAKIKTIIIFATLAIVVSSIFLLKNNNPYYNSKSEGSESLTIRKVVWRGAINVWKRYPIFGSGPETFAYSYYKDRPVEHNQLSEWDFLYNKAHNELLNYLATTGLVGVCAYLFLIYSFIYSSIQFLQKSNKLQLKIVISALLTGFIALTITNWGGFSTITVTTLMYLFMASVAIITKTNQSVNKKIDLNLKILPQLIIVCTAFTICINICKNWTADVVYATAKKELSNGYSDDAINHFDLAIELSPKHAVYYKDLAGAHIQRAINLAANDELDKSVEHIQAAIANQQFALLLNPTHLVIYKSLARQLLLLSQLIPDYLQTAEVYLLTAQELSPTDPSIPYNLGLIQLEHGKTNAGIQSLEEAINLKPNYAIVRLRLARTLAEEELFNEALKHYDYYYEYIDSANVEINDEMELVRESLVAQ